MISFTPRSVALFAISTVMGSTLPLAATQARFLYEQGTITTKEGTVVRLHRSYTARDRVDYKRALEIYEQYLQQGFTDLVRPIINERDTIDPYLLNPTDQNRDRSGDIFAPTSTKDYVAPEAQPLSKRALNDQERSALARSFKTGICWTYKQFSKEFDMLCRKLILGRTAVRATGFESDLMRTRAGARLKRGEIKQPKTLFDGLKDNRQGGRIVPRGKSGGRGTSTGTRILPYAK